MFSLIARNREKCTHIQNDLKTRNPDTECKIYQVDFTDAGAINQTIASIAKTPVDIALIAHGTLPDQAECEKNLNLCRGTLMINGTSPVLFAEAFAEKMAPLDHGHIVLISSVAGDRGRKSNYVYGAAKGLVTRYAQGLQHRFNSTGVSITLIKPGPTKTPMTEKLDNSAAFADVRQVAKEIIGAIDSKKNTAYSPRKWAVIMMIIRHLPGTIFNKLNL